jgi:hypothetical protein
MRGAPNLHKIHEQIRMNQWILDPSVPASKPGPEFCADMWPIETQPPGHKSESHFQGSTELMNLIPI